MTKASRGFTLMHNRSKFHEKRGFRLEQIRQKQAKGFGRTPSFRHDIGFRLEQIRLKQAKGFGKAPSFGTILGFGCAKRSFFGTLSLQAEQTEGLPYHERLLGIGWASMACGCCNICEEKRRFRLHTALFRATEPPPTTPSEPPRHARPIGR